MEGIGCRWTCGLEGKGWRGLAVAEQQWTCDLVGEGGGKGGGVWLLLSSSGHVVLWERERWRGWRGLTAA